MKEIRIFAASPADMAAERSKIRIVADLLKPLASALHTNIEILDWKVVVPDMGRPEQVILEQLKPSSWDIFIGILWHRFGTPPGNANSETRNEYLSGTEEEFHTAYKLWEKYHKPRLIIYRCTRPIPPDLIDPDQYKSVKAFFAKFDPIKGEHPGIYQTFDTTISFERLLVDNLQKLLLEYTEDIKGEPVSPKILEVYAPKMPDNLPRRLVFFGRESEIEKALLALAPDDRSWGLLIDGIGGIGKTALAIEAAYLAKERNLFDAFVFVTAKERKLTPVGILSQDPTARTVDEFLNETARILGHNSISDLPAIEKRRVLLDTLRSLKALLIYDNLETLTKEEQEALADFLRELPTQCKAIVTSRRRRAETAVWLRLDKLDWNSARAIIENEIKEDEQLAKKMDMVPKDQWQELYEGTYGSPLALVHILGLMRFRASLTYDGAIAMLRNVESDDTLQTFIYQEAQKELTPNDITALSALSLFDPYAHFAQWMEIAHLSRSALESAIDRLGALSLVSETKGEEQYILHPLTRAFVQTNYLHGENEERMVLDFANYWFLNHVKRYCGMNGTRHRYLNVEPIWGNVDSALERLWRIALDENGLIKSQQGAELLVMMINSLRLFLGLTGRQDDMLKLLNWGYELTVKLKNSSKAGWFAFHLSQAYFFRKSAKETDFWATKCEKAWDDTVETPTKLGQKSALLSLKGIVSQQSKRYKEAERFLRESLKTSKEGQGNPEAIATNLNRLGDLYHVMKRYKTAQNFYLDSYEMAKRTKDPKRMCTYAVNLGILAFDQKLFGEAKSWFAAALPIAREYSIVGPLGDIQYYMARIHKIDGLLELSMDCAQESLAIRKRLFHSGVTKSQKLVTQLEKALHLN